MFQKSKTNNEYSYMSLDNYKNRTTRSFERSGIILLDSFALLGMAEHLSVFLGKKTDFHKIN
jgi:hypothetical protein